MSPAPRWTRALLRSRPVRALFETLVDDHRERHDSCVAVAVRAALVNQTPGDYLEFGVHTGRSFVTAAQVHARDRARVLAWPDFRGVDAAALPPMRFFAFDAFDRGFPEPAGPDASELRPVQWSAGGMRTREADFLETCRRAGLDMSRVHVLAGYFADTLTEAARREHGLERAAVAHFDCDLYASTARALAFCEPLTDVGSVFIFDDWFRFRGSERHGQHRAFAEWRQEHPRFGFRELHRWRAGAVAFICSRAD